MLGTLLLGGLLGGGLNFGAGLMSSLLGASSAEDANESAERIAAENRAWMTRMANTAHQREVADLRAAGLNPILSATGGSGAATPSADTSVNYQVPKWDLGDPGSGFMQGANSAMSFLRLGSEINATDAAARQANSAAALNGVKAKSAAIDNAMKAATAQYKIDLQRLGVKQAEVNYQRAISALSVEARQNAFMSTDEGFKIWRKQQEAKRYPGSAGAVINVLNSLSESGEKVYHWMSTHDINGDRIPDDRKFEYR